MTTLYSYLFVALGGALGAMARLALNFSLQRETELPWGTFASNLLGCLVMGVIAQLIVSTAWFNDAGIIPDQYRLLFAVGFCGSFTTLSAFMFELNVFLQRNDILTAFAYLFATIIGGFACFYVGIMLARALMTGDSA